MRRILQASGGEVIHLGHNRSVDEVVTAALQEDVQGIAVTSYQGGHVEYFKYMLDLLRERGGENIKVFGGGGGVIVPAEIRELHDYGVTRIYSPEDGARMGLQGMINDMIQRCDDDLAHVRAEGSQGGRRRATASARAADHRARERRGRAGHRCVDRSCASRRARADALASRRSASPAPAAPANPRSPTSWCCASASTRKTG